MNECTEGVVHRTFLGPFLIAMITKPFSYLFQSEDKFYVQIQSRVVLSLVVMYSFSQFGRSIQLRYGSTTRRALSVLTLTQFHFLFYSSRCLPNTFALIAVMIACGKWLEKRWSQFIFLVAFTVLVLRVETIILFSWIIIYELIITRDLKFWHLIKVGIPSGLISLVITIAFDSYIWGKLIWPEGDQRFYLLTFISY